MSKENSVETKEELLRHLRHEIKNPLSTIYLAIDGVKGAKEDMEDLDFYIDMLQKAAQKIDSILSENK